MQKPPGRKRGVPNKATSSIREKVQLLFNRYSADQMYQDLMKLGAKDRLWVLHGLAEFIAPKLQRTEVRQENTGETTIRVVYDDPSAAGPAS